MAKEKNPVAALIYDFDGTLAPGNMQEFSFIKALGMSKDEFWAKANKLGRDNDASGILCYMKVMLDEARHKGISLKRESFRSFGAEIDLFNGVEKWFALVNDYGRSIGLDVRHYINSSGLKEMIEGSSIAREFTDIYACSFLYNVDGVASWPAVAVDFTTKTRFLFEINKGIPSSCEEVEVNRFVPDDERPVPFSRMIYFGDGFTDIPCMKVVKSSGGHSIAVYKPRDAEKREKVARLITENRVNFVCPADYSEGRDIHNIVKTILDKIKSDYEFAKLLKKHQADAAQILAHAEK